MHWPSPSKQMHGERHPRRLPGHTARSCTRSSPTWITCSRSRCTPRSPCQPTAGCTFSCSIPRTLACPSPAVQRTWPGTRAQSATTCCRALTRTCSTALTILGGRFCSSPWSAPKTAGICCRRNCCACAATQAARAASTGRPSKSSFPSKAGVFCVLCAVCVLCVCCVCAVCVCVSLSLSVCVVPFSLTPSLSFPWLENTDQMCWPTPPLLFACARALLVTAASLSDSLPSALDHALHQGASANVRAWCCVFV